MLGRPLIHTNDTNPRVGELGFFMSRFPSWHHDPERYRMVKEWFYRIINCLIACDSLTRALSIDNSDECRLLWSRDRMIKFSPVGANSVRHSLILLLKSQCDGFGRHPYGNLVRPRNLNFNHCIHVHGIGLIKSNEKSCRSINLALSETGCPRPL